MNKEELESREDESDNSSESLKIPRRSTRRGLSDGVDPVGADVEGPGPARQPRHESGRAGADGPRGRPSKLGRLVGRGRPPPLTYRVTQVLTGYGCFGEYLHRIKKEAWIRRSTRWSSVRRGRGRAAISSWKSDGTSRRRRSSRYCWRAREGGGP